VLVTHHPVSSARRTAEGKNLARQRCVTSTHPTPVKRQDPINHNWLIFGFFN